MFSPSYLIFQSTEKIIELQAAIVKAFPFCDDQNKKSDAGFTPHLTVGQWNTRGVEQKKKEFTDSTLSQIKTFQVTHIDFISRNGDVPFEVHYQVSLGGGVKKITGSTHESASNDKVLMRAVKLTYNRIGEFLSEELRKM